MSEKFDLNMYAASLSISGKQMNGAVTQPPVIPPPRLGDLSVTDNGDYSASSEGLDGYANVGVDVAGSAPVITPQTITGIAYVDISYGSRGSVSFHDWQEKTLAEISNIQNSSNGEYYFYSGATATLLVPVKKIYTGAISSTGTVVVIFTPDAEFDGIYVDGTKYTPTTSITPGDGKWYAYVQQYMYGETYQAVGASNMPVNLRIVSE